MLSRHHSYQSSLCRHSRVGHQRGRLLSHRHLAQLHPQSSNRQYWHGPGKTRCRHDCWARWRPVLGSASLEPIGIPTLGLDLLMRDVLLLKCQFTCNGRGNWHSRSCSLETEGCLPFFFLPIHAPVSAVLGVFTSDITPDTPFTGRMSAITLSNVSRQDHTGGHKIWFYLGLGLPAGATCLHGPGPLYQGPRSMLHGNSLFKSTHRLFMTGWNMNVSQ